MTLYLKYRPHTFADVVGQDHVVTTLERAVERKQVSHAYLLCGSRGTGKTSVARILAKTILTADIEDKAIREALERGVDEGAIVDLIEIDAASNRRIDDVRELIERINFSPVAAKAKVYIIDEVHMLTKEAFNALLKTLEEPPDYAYFILATTELHKVPDTIQSRCQRFLFRRVKSDDIIGRLQYIADQERITIDRDALRAIARHATGSFRDAISLLDQLRSLEKIGLSDVTERIGRTAESFGEDIVAAIVAQDSAGLSAIVDAIEQSNAPMDQVLIDILEHEREAMRGAVAEGRDASVEVARVDTVLRALKDIRNCPIPALVLESVLIELVGAATRQTVDIQKVRPVKAESSAKAMPKKEAPKTHEAREEAPAPRAAVIEAEDLTIENVMRHWPTVVQKTTPPSVRMSLKNGTVSSVSNGTIVVNFPSGFHRDKVAETAGSRAIEEVLQTIFLQPVRIKCVLEHGTSGSAKGPATDLVEAAGEIFGKGL